MRNDKKTDCNIVPLVSILVITYNHEKYIRECLDSLLNQRVDFPYEIIIGEDCSVDRTREIVVEYAHQHSEKITAVLNDANIGANANIRNIFNRAKGEYVAFCEGDDFWHDSGKLGIQIAKIEKTSGVSLVASDFNTFYQDSKKLHLDSNNRRAQWDSEIEDVTKEIFLRKRFVHTCTMLLKKETLSRIWTENPYEFSSYWPMGDIQLAIEASRLGTIYFIKESLATYRVQKQSSTRIGELEGKFKFLVKITELMEYYGQKLGYDESIINQSRLGSWRSFVLLSMQSADKELKKVTSEHIRKYPVKISSLLDRWLAWSNEVSQYSRATVYMYPKALFALNLPQSIFYRLRYILNKQLRAMLIN